MQRIMRSGSSLNVMSGSSGVRMVRSFRSSSPPKGSTSSPKRVLFRQTAMALMVKSLRFWSSSSVPSSTIGLRLSWLYDSLRAPTNSTSVSLNLTCAVPKFLKTDTCAPRPSFCRKPEPFQFRFLPPLHLCPWKVCSGKYLLHIHLRHSIPVPAHRPFLISD